jgi:hypothetical protein
MARYCAFASYFKKAGTDLDLVKKNFRYEETVGIGSELAFSAIKDKDPTISKLE